MIYLLTSGWPWFAAAACLGAFVGFLTYRTDRDAVFSGGWIVVAGAGALLAGLVVSQAQLVSGAAAVTFDIALLCAIAYALGLPIGGLAKALRGARPETPMRRVITPLLPAVAEDQRAAVEPPATPPELHAALAEMKAAAARMPASGRARGREAKKGHPGVAPLLLSAPHGGVADDLARIRGLGPKSLEKLQTLGVFHYAQIAAWNLDNARWISAALGAPGRVERGKWIQQAQALRESHASGSRASDAA
jgi:predicted flap endonuclease-1-like 5' DNA nuclease